ncbi:MAG: hypothetical protein ACREXT_06700, partial [Gammaproteobacteria bacterium]
MDRARADWRILQGALGVFAFSVLLALSILTVSNMFWREMLAEYQSNYTRFREVSAKYLAVDDEERVIAEQYPKFIALYRRGVIGDEHRLSWIEALESIGEELDLPELEYTIEAQQPVATDFALDTRVFDVNSSVMELSLGLLHEGDLVRVLDHLDRAAEGLYTVEACDVTRQALPPTKALGLSANLRAECRLRWFTLDRPGDAKVKL